MNRAKAKIYPFLWYARDADQAAAFYASIFPDSRVDRVTTMQSARELGCTRFIEAGPGNVLAGLARRIDRELSVTPVGKATDVAALSGQAAG